MSNAHTNDFKYTNVADFDCNLARVSFLANRKFPEIGDIYTHFKGKKVIVVNVALDSETCEPVIIYRHIDEDNCWSRKAMEFLAPTDVEKYPNATQKYRFERELPIGITETVKYKETLELIMRSISNKEKAHDYVIEHFYI